MDRAISMKNAQLQTFMKLTPSAVDETSLNHSCCLCFFQEDERVISFERGKQLADSLGLEFFETSAKENINVRVSSQLRQHFK